MLPPPRRPRVDPIDATLVLARAKLDEAEELDDALKALSAVELAAAWVTRWHCGVCRFWPMRISSG